LLGTTTSYKHFAHLENISWSQLCVLNYDFFRNVPFNNSILFDETNQMIKSCSDQYFLYQGSATYGPRAGSGQTSNINRPAAPLQIAETVWPA